MSERRTYSRRDVLKYGLRIGAAAAGAAVLDACGVVEDPNSTPDALFVGDIEIKKGVRIRLEPRVTDDTIEPSNTIDWTAVHTINGQNVTGEEIIKLQNAGVKYGFNAQEGRYDPKRKEPWIMLPATWKGFGDLEEKKGTVFVNAGPETREYVTFAPDVRLVAVPQNSK